MYAEKEVTMRSVDTHQKLMARQKLGQMLAKVDRDIAAGTPMRDFEDVFVNIAERIENA